MTADDFKFADDDRDDECSRDETEQHDADPFSCTVFADSIQKLAALVLNGEIGTGEIWRVWVHSAGSCQFVRLQ